MGMLADDISVLPTGNLAPPAMATNPKEAIHQKVDYAATVTAPTKSKSNRLADPNVKARITTNNGMPMVIFKSSDYNGVMAGECKYTIIGKFLRTHPNIERIKSVLAEKVSLKGEVTIGVYDYRTVFIDVANDEDCKIDWYK